MRKRLTTLTVAAAFLCMSSPLQAGQDCFALLEQNCTSCHYKNRICEKIGKKNRRSWKNTTKRMLRYGLELDKTGLDEITECLVSLDTASEKFCD